MTGSTPRSRKRHGAGMPVMQLPSKAKDLAATRKTGGDYATSARREASPSRARKTGAARARVGQATAGDLAAGVARARAGKNRLVKSFCCLLLVLGASVFVAQAAWTCTKTSYGPDINGVQATIVTGSGSLASSAAVTCSVAIAKPTIAGGVQMLTTGNGSTETVTVRIYDSAFGFGSATEDSSSMIFSQASAAGVSGRQTLSGALFENPAASVVNGHYVLPPTTVTFDLLNGAADATTVTTMKVIFLHSAGGK